MEQHKETVKAFGDSHVDKNYVTDKINYSFSVESASEYFKGITIWREKWI